MKTTKNAKAAVSNRNPYVLPMLLSRKGGSMKHRTEGRGGAKNRQADFRSEKY